MRLSLHAREPRAEDRVEPSPIRLLTLLAAPRADAGELGDALSALTPLQTARLLESIAHHRIDGLAHRALSRLPAGDVDPWLRSALRRRHQHLAAATLSQGLALSEILETFHRARFPVVVMRGLRSVEGIYGDPGSRPFEDHDLLVPPSGVEKARRVLVRMGFEEAAPGLLRRRGTIVDLHSDPFGARRRPTRGMLFPLAVEALFDRAAPGRVAGAPALLLDKEDEFLLLAVHLVKHSFDRLIRIADLAHLLTSRCKAICWRTLRCRAEASRTLPLLAWALESATLLGAAIPADLLPSVPRGAVEAALMWRVLDLRPLPYSGEVLMALAAPGLGARLHFLMDALLPADEAPGGALAKTTVVPHRAVRLLRQAAGQIAERRRAR